VPKLNYNKNKIKPENIMSNELMPFDLPEVNESIIKVIGVGGGGGNAVNNMFKEGIKDVDFVICNTDAQALRNSPITTRIQLGATLTKGLGAGNKPDQGKEAAIETIEELSKIMDDGTQMVFITAGMGGGTGTGAAPIIAEAAKELGLLTVAIVTIPFRHEGQRRIKQAIEGVDNLSKHVDSLLVINNEKLREVYGDLTLSNAFGKADDILTIAVKGIAEIITVHGYINVDFADVKTVMSDSGIAIMGTGYAEGEDRAINAVKDALNSPLLNNNEIKGAKNLLLNIISGTEEITMDEIGAINDYVQEASGNTADLIWGNTTNPDLENRISVTVVATGFDTDVIHELYSKKQNVKTIHNLDNDKIKIEKIRDEEEVKQNEENELINEQEKKDEQEKKLKEEQEQEQEHKLELKKQEEKAEQERRFKAVQIEKQDKNEFFVIDIDDEHPFEKDTEKNGKVLFEEEVEVDFIEVEKMNESRKRIAMEYNDSKKLESLENVPAYKRKKMKLDLEKIEKSNVSKYKLED